MENKRTIGTAIFAILFIVLGLLGFLSSVNSLVTDRNLIKAIGGFAEDPLIRDILKSYEELIRSAGFITAMSINALVSLIIAVLGAGVWRLREWARRATVIFFIVTVPVCGWAGDLVFAKAQAIFQENELYMLYYVFGGISLRVFLSALNLFFLIVNAVVVALYFANPKVKKQFS